MVLVASASLGISNAAAKAHAHCINADHRKMVSKIILASVLLASVMLSAHATNPIR